MTEGSIQFQTHVHTLCPSVYIKPFQWVRHLTENLGVKRVDTPPPKKSTNSWSNCSKNCSRLYLQVTLLSHSNHLSDIMNTVALPFQPVILQMCKITSQLLHHTICSLQWDVTELSSPFWKPQAHDLSLHLTPL